MAACAVLFVGASADAYKITISEDSSLSINYLLQMQALAIQQAAPEPEKAIEDRGYSKDLFVRRSRFLLGGDLSKYVSFFMETDQPNIGRNGDWSSPTYVQDAWMTFKPLPELVIDAGMMPVPFTRHILTSAASLNGMDFYGAVLKMPTGSHRVFRDTGVQLHGIMLDKKLVFRAGVFSGSQNIALKKDATGKTITASNPTDKPRVAGIVRYAILGTEGEYGLKGIYFSTEPILSVGLSADYVPDSVWKSNAVLDASGAVTQSAVLNDHLGYSADFFLEFPIDADNEIIATGAVMRYVEGAGMAGSGLAMFVEAGYRWTFVEPIISFVQYKSVWKASDYQALHAGASFWIAKHQSSVKVDFASEKTGDLAEVDAIKTFGLQGQLLF